MGTPHDLFFKYHMKDMQVAKDFLTAHLPSWLQVLMDFKELKSEPGEFVDEQLRKFISDQLFSVPIKGNKSLIYVLVEHQSQPDPIMAFRVHQYMLRIMELHLREGKKSPNIYPFVFYNGEKDYEDPIDFTDLFDSPSLARDLLFKEVQLVNLKKFSDEELSKHTHAGLFQLCMKHIYDDNIMPFVRQSMRQIRHLEQAGQQDAILAVTNYWLEAGKIHDKMELMQTLTKGVSKHLGERIMTTADFLRQEGREEGLQMGLEKCAANLLEQGYVLADIAKLTGLTLASLAKLFPQATS